MLLWVFILEIGLEDEDIIMSIVSKSVSALRSMDVGLIPEITETTVLPQQQYNAPADYDHYNMTIITDDCLVRLHVTGDSWIRSGVNIESLPIVINDTSVTITNTGTENLSLTVITKERL